MSSLSRLSRNVRQTLIHGCKSFSIGSGYHGTHYDVIISGGGMVGFAMACSLGKSSYLSNMKFLLVESSKPKKLDLDAGYNIRVCALNPGSKTLLESLGAWKHIEAARYCPVRKIRFGMLALMPRSPLANKI